MFTFIYAFLLKLFGVKCVCGEQATVSPCGFPVCADCAEDIEEMEEWR